jgi:hypothetical protein
MSSYLTERVRANLRIHVLLQCELREIEGSATLEKVHPEHTASGETSIEESGGILFLLAPCLAQTSSETESAKTKKASSLPELKLPLQNRGRSPTDCPALWKRPAPASSPQATAVRAPPSVWLLPSEMERSL